METGEDLSLSRFLTRVLVRSLALALSLSLSDYRGGRFYLELNRWLDHLDREKERESERERESDRERERGRVGEIGSPGPIADSDSLSAAELSEGSDSDSLPLDTHRRLSLSSERA